MYRGLGTQDLVWLCPRILGDLTEYRPTTITSCAMWPWWLDPIYSGLVCSPHPPATTPQHVGLETSCATNTSHLLLLQ